jgi:hypothetical protein
MKNSLRLLFLFVILFFASCEKEDINTIGEIPTVSETDRIIKHFFDLTTYPNSTHAHTGETVRLAPKRWRGDVRIYLDNSVNNNDRQIIYNIIDSVSVYIEGSGVNFIYTDDIDNFDFGIVNGTPEYMNSVFGTNSNSPDGWLGATSGYSNCVTIEKRYMWYDGYNSMEILIGHELGHGLGLSHAKSGESLMYHWLNQNDDFFTKQDIAVLKLLYYDGVYGENFPASTDVELCNEQYLTDTQEEDLREKLRLIIENDFN